MASPEKVSRAHAKVIFGVVKNGAAKNDRYYEACEYFANRNDSWGQYIKPKEFFASRTPEEARAFLRKVLGPIMTKIEPGSDEYEQVMLYAERNEPYTVTNNQRSITEYYKVGDVEYHITYADEITVDRVSRD